MTTKFFIKNGVYNRRESVKDLLKQGADPNVQNKYGNTPLIIEVCSGRDQDVKDWVFLCGKCLTEVKSKYEDTYQYGGTWKSKKK